MYRITPKFDPKNTLDTTCTIDAACVLAAKLSKTEDSGSGCVVRDGDRIRALGREGKAYWADPCTYCKGTGKEMTLAFMGVPGLEQFCNRCLGTKVVEGVSCAY